MKQDNNRFRHAIIFKEVKIISDNYYEILGVSPGVSLKELEKAYRKKALECHPDRAAINNISVEEATTKFQELNEAYKKLEEQIKNLNTSPQPNSPNPSDPGF